MTKTYVIPDLHGRFDLLEAALRRIDREVPGTIVFLGDYIDRGPQSRQVVERVMAGAQIAGQTWVALKGNHEDMMRRAYADLACSSWWLQNGGAYTMISYGAQPNDKLDAISRLIPKEHIDWIRALPIYHKDAHRIYVHAGINFLKPFEDQSKDEDILLWIRYGFDKSSEHSAAIGYDGPHIVHGHTPFAQGPVIHRASTNLDVGAYATDRLAVGIFDDDIAGGPVATWDITI